MVTKELKVSDLVILADSGRMTRTELTEDLMKVEKKELVEHIVDLSDYDSTEMTEDDDGTDDF